MMNTTNASNFLRIHMAQAITDLNGAMADLNRLHTLRAFPKTTRNVSKYTQAINHAYEMIISVGTINAMVAEANANGTDVLSVIQMITELMPQLPEHAQSMASGLVDAIILDVDAGHH